MWLLFEVEGEEKGGKERAGRREKEKIEEEPGSSTHLSPLLKWRQLAYSSLGLLGSGKSSLFDIRWHFFKWKFLCRGILKHASSFKGKEETGAKSWEIRCDLQNTEEKQCSAIQKTKLPKKINCFVFKIQFTIISFLFIRLAQYLLVWGGKVLLFLDRFYG